MAYDQGQVSVPVDEAPQGGDDGASGIHEVNAHEFQNMRLSIGTQGRAMLDIALSENLDDTRSIDVRLRHRQTNGPQAAGAAAAPTELAPPLPEPGDSAPDQQAAPPPGDGTAQGGAGARGGRLKITVAAEHDDADDDKEYLDKMRGWLMTVATLFVNMAFQATLHPPDWLLTSGDTAFFFYIKSARLPFYRDRRLFTYLVVNTLTFGPSLALVVVLLQETRSARRTLTLVTAMVCVVSGSLAATFALVTSESWKVVHTVYVAVVLYESYIAGRVYLGREPVGYVFARLADRRVPGRR